MSSFHDAPAPKRRKVAEGDTGHQQVWHDDILFALIGFSLMEVIQGSVGRNGELGGSFFDVRH